MIILFLLLLCFTASQAQTDTTYQLNPTLLLENVGEKSIEEALNVSVVTASRIGNEKSSQAPATIVVITAEQILLRNYNSLLDVLTDLSEIKVDFNADPRWAHDISIRGIRGMDKFVILLDGIRISSPTNDLIQVMENYPVNFAKQIEIIFGPASALYGADAFTGVINIISKTADDIQKAQLSLQTGMYQSYLANLLTAKRFNKDVSLMLSGQFFHDEQPNLSKFYPNDYKGLEETLQSGTYNVFGFPTRPRAKVNPTFTQSPLMAYAITTTLQVKKFNFSFFRNYAENPTTNASNPYSTVFNKGAFFGHAVTKLSGIYEHQTNRWTFSTFLVGSRYDLNSYSHFRNIYTAMEPAYKFSYGWLLKAEQLASYKISNKANLIGGITQEEFFSIPRGHDLEFVTEGSNPSSPIINSIYPYNPEGISADFPRVRYRNTGGFVQVGYTPTDKLSITAGTRYDYNSRFKGTLNPRIGVVYKASRKVIIKSLYGSAFLAPSPLEAYNQFGSFFSLDSGRSYQSAFFRLPNPDLAPQIIRTFEIGANYFANKHLRLNFVVFYSAISGLFSNAPDAGNTNLYDGKYKGWEVGFIEVRVNQGKQKNYGFHLGADYLKEFSSQSSLTCYAALSFVNGVVQDRKNNYVEAESITPLMFRVGGTFSYKKWSFSPRVLSVPDFFAYTENAFKAFGQPIDLYVGKQGTFQTDINNPERRQRINGYTVADLSINYRLNKAVTFSLIGRNVTDTRYRHVNLGASPQTAVVGAAAAELSNGIPQYPIRIFLAATVKF